MSGLLSLNECVLELPSGLEAGPYTFAMESGQAWALVGANGSGKTLVGQVLAGQGRVSSGTARFPERSGYVSFERIDEIIEQERYNDDSDLTNRVDPGRLAGEFILEEGGRADELGELSRLLGVDGLLERGIKYLSTGEMRKVLICRALIAKPRVLVLDEPFEGLDAGSREHLGAMIGDLAGRGVGVILVVNRFDEILPWITHVGYVRDRRLVLAGEKDAMLASAALQLLHTYHHSLPEELPGQHRLLDAGRFAGDPLIRMNQVRVAYGDTTILREVDWTVRRGQHWRIAGPNGCGKSTLLSLVSGDHPQGYANDIELFGVRRGTGETVWDVKRRIGLVSTLLQRDYRVRTTVLTAVVSGFFDSIGVYGKVSAQQRQEALHWLDILQLADKQDVPLRSLSYGEQRLVLIARAMVKHPEVLVLDEPCLGLDAPNREMVLKLIDHVAQHSGTHVLYVSHHAEETLSSITHHLNFVPVEGGGYTCRTGCARQSPR